MKKTAPFLLLIILFAAAGWYSLTKQPDEVHDVSLPGLPTPVPVEEKQPEVQQQEVVEILEPLIIPDPLPVLNDSDPELTAALAEIMGAGPLAEYLVKSQAISRIVATIDSLTYRQVPSQINPVKPPEDTFITVSEGESVIMAAENFARYDAYVALLQNLDNEALIALYHRYSPLFQQAWEENGGEGSFDDRLLDVIDHLLETPEAPGPVYLTKPEAVYLFVEPELEAMTAGQKILLRMGALNAALVKQKIRELKEKL
jgi:hypothetical protein